jgi:CubicO group peptidase (beta-lactamase class C family)
MLCFLATILGVALLGNDRAADPNVVSPRAQVTVENWDKGGPLSRWVYTHVSEVFPTALVRRAGAVVELPEELRPEIGGLKVNGENEADQTLDQFVSNGAVDGCIVLHAGKIVYEKYPTIHQNDLHLMMSVTKAFVGTALAILEDEGKIDLRKPVENYLSCATSPICAQAWKGVRQATTLIATPSTRNFSSKLLLAGNRALRLICLNP